MNIKAIFKKTGIALAIVAGLTLLGWYINNSPQPLSTPPALKAALPAANPPAGMQLYQLPTGVNHRTAAFAYRGGSFFDKREFTMAAILIKHPKGDLLIDGGFGKNVKQHFATMPWYFRAVTDFAPGVPAIEQLQLAGYNPDSIKNILLTHAHWDHVSGIEDFSNTPVQVSDPELQFINSGNKLCQLAQSINPARYKPYQFEEKPYLGFDKSYDYYADGSIVIVPAPGHTPGSIIVFVTTPEGKRYAFIGDLAWQAEGVTLLEERPLLQSTLGDYDRTGVQDNLRRVYAIAEKYPQIVIVPAHDARPIAGIPAL